MPFRFKRRHELSDLQRVVLSAMLWVDSWGTIDTLTLFVLAEGTDLVCEDLERLQELDNRILVVS